MNSFGLSPTTIMLFVIGAILLTLSFLPRFKSVRRLFRLSETQVTVKPVIGVRARNQEVTVDGKFFQNCEFENCTFLWNGGPWGLKDCKISSNRRLRTDNPKIANTVDVLKALGFLSDDFGKDWRRHPKGYFKDLR